MDAMDTSTPFTVDWRSLCTIAIVLTVGSVAASAGVGGGAIFIPLLQAVAGFGLKDSTALSQALITAGSLVTVALNLYKPSPLAPDKCLINFDLALLLTPLLLSGVSIGVLGNTIFPPWLVTLLLILLMLLLVMQAASKGMAMWHMESKMQRQEAEAAANAAATAAAATAAAATAAAATAARGAEESGAGAGTRAGAEVNSTHPPLAASAQATLAGNGPSGPRPATGTSVHIDVAAGLSRLPCRSLALMTTTWIIFAALQVTRSLPSVERCSRTYWLLLVAQLTLMLLASCMQAAAMLESAGPPSRSRRRGAAGSRVKVVVRHAQQEGEEEGEEEEGEGEEEGEQEGEAGTRQPLLGRAKPSAEGERVLSGGGGALAAASAVACTAGLVAGLLGLGGGMVISPLLLQLGVHPQIAGATSSLMVLFSSSGALLSFVVLRRINPQYALVYGAASMLASVLGVLVLGGMIKRTGRSSLVVFALALVMGTGLVCITGFGVQTLEEAWAARSQGLGFHDLCA